MHDVTVGVTNTASVYVGEEMMLAGGPCGFTRLYVRGARGAHAELCSADLGIVYSLFAHIKSDFHHARPHMLIKRQNQKICTVRKLI